MSLQNRLRALENKAAGIGPGPADPVVEARLAAFRRILDSLSPKHRAMVTEDVITGADWYSGKTHRITEFMHEMTLLNAHGIYTGRLAFPAIIVESALDTYKTADRRSVAQSRDYVSSNVMDDGQCRSCGWRWWNRRLRDELRQCPGCDGELDLHVSPYELDCFLGPRRGFTIPEEKRRRIADETWQRAVAWYGIEGAEQWRDTWKVRHGRW